MHYSDFLPSYPKGSWKPVGLLIGVYLLSLCLAGLVAPFFYKLTVWWNIQSPNGFNHYLVGKGLSVFVDRVRLVLLVIALPYLLRKAGLTQAKALHLEWNKIRLTDMLYFALGIVLVGWLVYAQFHQGLISGRDHLGIKDIGWIIIKSFVAACTISVLEEIIFRGLCWRSFFHATRSFYIATLLVAILFASVHFKAPRIQLAFDQVTIWSGLQTAGAYLWPSGQPTDWLPFLNLVVLGIVLTFIYSINRSLWPNIAFHAGLVFASLIYKKLAIYAAAGSDISFWGSARLIDGWASLCILSGLSIVFAFKARKSKSNCDQIE